MAEAVGGAFLSAFLDVVFDKLATDEVVDFIRGKKVDLNLLCYRTFLFDFKNFPEKI